MADFHVRADSVDVEQIMRQIRGRIREKRGVDYTEEQIQELARVKLERFLDPRGVRSDLLDQFRRTPPPDSPATYEFDDQTLFASDKPLVRFFRRLMRPFLKLLLNPNTLNHILHTQAGINRFMVTFTEQRSARDVLFYEVIHNLVVEMTRASIDVKNMKMQVESLASRLDFAERRARALEAIVQYRPDALGDEARGPGGHRVRPGEQPVPPEGGGAAEGEGGAIDPVTGGESLRTRRRRRRRGRRSGPGFAEGTPVPGTPVPESPVPESLVPESPVPGSSVPESLVPESPVPESLVPESLVPESSVPESPVAESESGTPVSEGDQPANAPGAHPDSGAPDPRTPESQSGDRATATRGSSDAGNADRDSGTSDRGTDDPGTLDRGTRDSGTPEPSRGDRSPDQP